MDAGIYGVINNLVDLFNSVTTKVSSWYSSLVNSDIRLFRTNWNSAAGQPDRVKTVLVAVADELETFLNDRKSQIESFAEEATKRSIQDKDFAAALFGVDQMDPALTPSEYEARTAARMNYLSNFLLRSYIQEATRDWEDIKRTFFQRTFYSEHDSGTMATLFKADWLANQCLSRAHEADLIPEQGSTPICYFDKNGTVNRAPYTNLPLIGLPQAATEDPAAFFAVLHEMGHYVYNRLDEETLKTIQKAAEERSPFPDDPIRWLSEIFADTFSRWVGGPAYDAQFREYLIGGADLSQEELAHDDGVHPPILIRLPDEDGDWQQLLSTLGIEKPQPLREQEAYIREISEKILSYLVASSSGANISPLDVMNPELYEDDYQYTKLSVPPALPRRDTPLQAYREELSKWGKDPWPTYPRPMPIP